MKRMLVLALALALFPLAAPAQDPQTAPKKTDVLAGRAGYADIGVGGGFMFDPDMGMGMVSLDYYITDEISVGPYIYMGGGGDNSFWAVAGQVKFCPELVSTKAVRPYFTGGIGFTDLDFHDQDRHTTFLFPVGGGLEWGFSDIMSIEAGAVYEITENTFSGLTIGLNILL